MPIRNQLVRELAVGREIIMTPLPHDGNDVAPGFKQDNSDGAALKLPANANRDDSENDWSCADGAANRAYRTDPDV